MRYRLLLAYDGTRYCGWQKQPGDITVQQMVEENMSMILRTQIKVVGCGRTDAGVHARCYVAHFEAADISDLDKFTASGGIVKFFHADGKIKFEINIGILKDSSLTISSRLLRLADVCCN